MSSLEEMAALKSAMYDRVSSRLREEFELQFSAQIVRLELEVSRLESELNNMARDRATRDACLGRIFDGRFMVGADPMCQEMGLLFYNLPAGQVSAHYYPTEFDLFNYIPRVDVSPWDGHSKQQAQARFEAFARMPAAMHLTFTEILKPLEARNLPRLRMDAKQKGEMR